MSDLAAGLIMGGLSLSLLFGAVIYFFRRRKKEKAQEAIALAEKEERFKNFQRKLDDIPERQPFLPDANFYTRYPHDPISGLQAMAIDLFDWLDIKPNGCVVDFYNEKEFNNTGADTAGFYTKIIDPETNKPKEVILINSKYYNNALAVGAILAHEMMHLYLFRHRIEIPNTFDNEQLTDLATIRSGLSVLILNGMSYSTQWWLSLLLIFAGVFYWRSSTQTFGYFQPAEYGKLAHDHFAKQKIDRDMITSHLNPSSRTFFPHSFYKRHTPANGYIKKLENKRLITRAVQVGVIVLLIYWVGFSDSDSSSTVSGSSYTTPASSSTSLPSTPALNQPPTQSLNNTYTDEITQCKSEVADKEAEIADLKRDLDNIERRMKIYERADNTYGYNSLVDDQNDLVDEIESQVAIYDNLVDDCNNLIDDYNANQR